MRVGVFLFLDVENATRDFASGVFLWGFTNCVGSFDVYFLSFTTS